MSDQWDAKYPMSNADWLDVYRHAREQIKSKTSPWNAAFHAVSQAEKPLERIRDNEEARLAVWEHLCVVFDEDPWPDYAQAVSQAVKVDPAFEKCLRQKEVGLLDGVPPPWWENEATRDPLKVWTFKVTVVMMAGLIEGVLPASLADNG